MSLAGDHSALQRQRVAVGLEYDGSLYSGWQKQASPAVPTIQSALEKALSTVADHPVKVLCAGRTDAGVHACGQVIHFETDNHRPEKAWVRGGNALLPKNVSILWAKNVPTHFHARFSASSRRYRYVIYPRSVRPALLHHYVTAHYRPLNVAAMAEAGQHLLGELDFSSYRASACQSSTPMREVTRLEVTAEGDFIVIDIEANAFLLHMVRNIAGVLMEIGDGRRAPSWALDVLNKKDRKSAGITAAPNGLYLVQVSYPQAFNLPELPLGPVFLNRQDEVDSP